MILLTILALCLPVAAHDGTVIHFSQWDDSQELVIDGEGSDWEWYDWNRVDLVIMEDYVERGIEPPLSGWFTFARLDSRLLFYSEVIDDMLDRQYDGFSFWIDVDHELSESYWPARQFKFEAFPFVGESGHFQERFLDYERELLVYQSVPGGTVEYAMERSGLKNGGILYTFEFSLALDSIPNTFGLSVQFNDFDWVREGQDWKRLYAAYGVKGAELESIGDAVFDGATAVSTVSWGNLKQQKGE